MVNRPKNLEKVHTRLIFNLQKFLELEIDLAHINRDGRANLSTAEVLEIVDSFLNGRGLRPSDTKEFGDEVCSYFVKTDLFKDKKYKLVFCICSDKPKTIGIITLYRV